MKILTMESLKGTTQGEDLYEKVSGVIERLKLGVNLPMSPQMDRQT